MSIDEFDSWWRSGFRLEDALYQFTSFAPIDRSDFQQRLILVPREYHSLARAGANLFDLREETKERKRQLLLLLEQSRLVALGYEVSDPARITRVPIAFLDTRYIKWNASSVVARGRIFEKVRIAEIRTVRSESKLLTPPPIGESAPEKSTGGRPSKRKAIFEALNQMSEGGVDLRKLTVRQVAIRVRRHAEREDIPVDKGFSDETIRGCLNKLLNSSRKPPQ